MISPAAPVLVQCDNGDEAEDAPIYEAARLGDTWNGMEVPWFTFENATKFFADLDELNVKDRGDWRYGYDAEADVFWEAYVDDNGQPESGRNATIGFEEVDGVKLYGPFDGYTFARVTRTDEGN